MAALSTRLAEAEATLHAIRLGKVDAVVVAGRVGPQVFTLQGAEHAYRVLIESMNEGALTLTAGKTVLYANRCFARMVRCPLEQVIGSSFWRFLSAGNLALFRPLLRRIPGLGAKVRLQLTGGDGSHLPVQISIRRLAGHGSDRGSIGLVVTDLAETRRTEDLLRALAHRVVQVQETERGRVATELHDHITQLLCGVLFRSQALMNSLAGRTGAPRREARALHRMVGLAASEVERISRDLRPGAIDHLGLVSVLLDTGREFTRRTGVPVRLAGVRLKERLPPATELALYRILQEALRNVAQHAHARQVTVDLKLQDNGVRLAINDDGVGFNPDRRTTRSNGHGGLGLLGMRERATHLGGSFTVRSRRHIGTKIEACIPVPFTNGTP